MAPSLTTDNSVGGISESRLFLTALVGWVERREPIGVNLRFSWGERRLGRTALRKSDVSVANTRQIQEGVAYMEKASFFYDFYGFGEIRSTQPTTL